MKRIERTGMIIRVLTENPNKLFSLNHFTNLFDAAKSTVSEDIAICRKIVAEMGDGEIITVAGAAGGVKYVPRLSDKTVREFQTSLAERLNEPGRVLKVRLPYSVVFSVVTLALYAVVGMLAG